MGRKERRKAQRAGIAVNQEKVFTLTESQIQEITKDAVLAGTKQGWNVCLMFVLMALRDRHGYGRKRLEDVCDSIEGKLELFNDGYVNMQDLVDTLYDETGVTIEIEGLKKPGRARCGG